MSGMTGAAIIALAGIIVLRGWMTGCDVYGAFLRGADRGMKSAMQLLPSLCAMLLMLAMVNASGMTEMLARVSSPLMKLMHIPEEATPLLWLRPLTGSGSLAALEEIFERCGPDSRAGRIASVLMGSSETIFYTMAVYLGAAGVKRLPSVLWVSLTSYVFSVLLTGWLL